MREFIVDQGLHGDIHRLFAVNASNRDAMPRQGGVLLIADEAGTPVYIGDAISIYEHLTSTDVWARAQRQFGRKYVYFLSTGIESWRASVTRSLREHHHPAMN